MTKPLFRMNWVAKGLMLGSCAWWMTGCVPASPPTTSAPVANSAAEVTTVESKEASNEKSVVLSPQFLSEAELKEGWISLFDGQTLFGWHAHSKADWQVTDGAITVTGGEPGLLCTPVRFADYVLKVDVQTDATSNSGIFLRTPAVVGKEDVTTRCYELNMAPSDNPFPTGSLVGRKKAVKPIDLTEWTTIEAHCEGNHITVTIGGEVVCDYTDEKPALSGFIGLQLNSGKASFKNIRLLPLSHGGPGSHFARRAQQRAAAAPSGARHRSAEQHDHRREVRDPRRERESPIQDVGLHGTR